MSQKARVRRTLAALLCAQWVAAVATAGSPQESKDDVTQQVTKDQSQMRLGSALRASSTSKLGQIDASRAQVARIDKDEPNPDPFPNRTPLGGPILPPGPGLPGGIPAPPTAPGIRPGGDVPRPTHGRIHVRVETSHCGFRLADLSVTAREGRFMPFFGGGGRWYGGDPITLTLMVTGIDSYQDYEAEVPLGSYLVHARFTPGTCPGGAWSPPSDRVTLTPIRPNADVTFRYDVPLTETRWSYATFASYVRPYVNDLRVRLNNYSGGRSGVPWYLANDAYIALDPDAGGGRLNLSIPKVRLDARILTAHYYVQDLNSQPPTLSYEAGRFHLRIPFESGGSEIKGRCTGGGCFTATDDAVPDGHIDDLVVDVFFQPVAFGHTDGSRGISIGNVEVQIHANLDGRGVLDLADWAVEDAIKDAVFPPVERMLEQILGQRALQEQIARAIRPALDLLGVGNVQSVEVRGDWVIVRHLPRA